MIKNKGKHYFSIFIFWLILLYAAQAQADRLYLKNGRSIEGIVKQEEENRLEFDVGIGFVTFRKSEIERLVRWSDADNLQLRQRWQEKKLRDEQDLQVRLEQERIAKEQAPKEVAVNTAAGHMVVKAILNGKINVNLVVDTGASTIMLSKSIGDKLGLGPVNAGGPENPIVEFTLADGRKSQARYTVLQSVKVQEAEAHDVAAAILLDPKANIVYDGLLGMSFLNKFNFKFDNKAGKLILEKIQ